MSRPAPVHEVLAVQLDTARRSRLVISLTPLIDVVFILLLFFLLTTQFGREQAITLDAPVTSASSSDVDDNTLSLSLAADGTIAFGNEVLVDLSSLRQNDLIIDARDAQTRLNVVVDDDVELQMFTSLMDQLSALGFSTISVRGLR